MTLWMWISEIAASGADAVGTAADWFVGFFAGVDPEARRQVAFSVALIALSAKMAKADGVVTADEVTAFRRLFAVPPSEERHVRRLFDLAKRDIAGYEAYAARIADYYGEDRQGLEDVVEDGVSGLLVPPSDPDRLARSLERFFLEDWGPRLREGVARGRARFTWEGLVDALVSLAGECR